MVNRFYAPDHSATSQILTDLATGLANLGNDVHVVTSRLRYDEPGASLPRRDKFEGVEVHRVWTSSFGRQSLPGRALDYASFYVSATVKVATLMERGDVVIAKTDPPMLSVTMALAAWIRGATYINWLQDVFPEVAGALGHWFGRGPAGMVLRWLRNASLKRARLNVAIGFRMCEALIAEGIDRDRIVVIPNWADGEAIRPIEPEQNPLRAKWNLRGRFVVGYSGNMGRAHEFVTILKAAELLRGEADITFLFIGGGAQRSMVEKFARHSGLENLLFKPYEPRTTLGLSLGVADIHLVSLRPELEGYIVPSKFYGIAAAGRPTVFIGETAGEIGTEIRKSECGLCVPQGDAAALASAVRELRAMPDMRRRMGRNARRLFETQHERKIGIERWRRLIDEVARVNLRSPTE